MKKASLLLVVALALTTLLGSVWLVTRVSASTEPRELTQSVQKTTFLQAGEPEIGDKVEQAEGTEPEEVQLEGVITSVALGSGTIPLTATLTVEGESEGGGGAALMAATTVTWTVHVDIHTRIRFEGRVLPGTILQLSAGQHVEVEGTVQGDGSVLANEILVKQEGEGEDHEVGFRGTIDTIAGIAGTLPLTLTVEMGPRVLTVIVDESTVIQGPDDQPLDPGDLEAGQHIKGKGVLQADDTILATEIEVLEEHEGPGHTRVRFDGEITELPSSGVIGDWTVETKASSSATVTFAVTATTVILPPGITPEVGDEAEVVAVRQGDDTLLALVVHVEKHADHPLHPVAFQGTVQTVVGDPPTEIVVDSRHVLITDSTRIQGTLAEGSHVVVFGFLQDDDTVQAVFIMVISAHHEHEVEFRGHIREIQDDRWLVGGFTVLITGTTTITGTAPQVGLIAEVKGTYKGPRTVLASEIEVHDPSAGHQRVVIRGEIVALTTTVGYTGTWAIQPSTDTSTVEVTVTDDTVLDIRHGSVQVGALVYLVAMRQEDGPLVAQRILIYEGD